MIKLYLYNVSDVSVSSSTKFEGLIHKPISYPL